MKIVIDIDIDKILKQVGYGCANCNEPDCEGNKEWRKKLKLAIQNEANIS